MNLSDLFARAARRSPDKLALRALPEAGPPSDWSYRQLEAAVDAAQLRFAELGVGAGDRIAFFLPNRPEWVSAHLALLRLGAMTVPINLAYRRTEMAHILGDAEPRLLLTDADYEELLRSLLPADGAAIHRVEELAPDTLSPSEAEPAAEPPDVPGKAGALILYTSGTTGSSKGAVLSHDNLRATVRSLLEAWRWESNDVLLLALPLFHTHGLVVGLHCALAAGATVHLRERFRAETVAEELSSPPDPRAGRLPSSSPTLFFGVPTMYVRLIAELRTRGGGDLSHLRLCCSGSAPLNPETFAAFRELTGHEILERYGMTETGMLLSNPYEGPRQPGTVGLELPGVQARVVGDDGQDLADGEEGELLVRGDNVFSGYWRAPEKTRDNFAADADGRVWFRTGDLARRDAANGYYTLLGRRHELIISGGFNVYPREVEEVLTTAPGILEAAVVGRRHPEWGEEVVAFVVTEGALDVDRLVEHCRNLMATFKVPRRIERLETLPRNALGKVQKHLLPT